MNNNNPEKDHPDFRESEYQKRQLEREGEFVKGEELKRGALVTEAGLQAGAIKSQDLAEKEEQRQIASEILQREEAERERIAQGSGESSAAPKKEREEKDDAKIRKKLLGKVKEAAEKKLKEKAVQAAEKKAGQSLGKVVIRQLGAALAALAGSFGWIALLIILIIIIIIAIFSYFYSQCGQNALAQEFCSVFNLNSGGSGFANLNNNQNGGQTPAGWQSNFSVNKPQDQISDADPALIALINCVNQAYPVASGWRVTSISDDNITPGLSECQGAQYSSSICQHSQNSCHYGGRNKCSYSIAFDAQTLSGGTNDPAFVTAVKDCNNNAGPTTESTHWHTNVQSRIQACDCGAN